MVLIITMIQDSINMFKKSRSDVLDQISERNESLYYEMRYLANDLYNDCSDIFQDYTSEKYDNLLHQVQNIINDKSSVLNNLEIFPDIMILMKNQDFFCSSGINAEEVKQILSTYWYIDNLTAPKDNFFSSRYYMENLENNLELCYVKTLWDKSGNYNGCIIVSLSSDYLKNVYKSMINSDYQFYVLDENGTAISHSIPSMLGCNLYYMPYFWSSVNPDSSCFVKKNSGIVLQTNSYNPETGWTVVEEIDYKYIFKSFSSVFYIGTLLVIFCFILSIGIAYLLAKKISRPIQNISGQIAKNPFEMITCETSYRELEVLTKIYNLTIKRINSLINKIKIEEKEKRKLELSFLQAQINPHFLHNTLFTIKCLIEMEKYKTADNMISSLLRLLKIPFNAKTEWIYIKDEIDYLKSYLSLMQYRYDQKKITLEISLTPDLEEILIPRLLLQPVIENSLFHAFDDSCKNGVINLSFRKIQSKILITIRDNGKGMSKDEINSLWNGDKRSKHSFNNISLINIKQRIQLLYGEGYGISVVSSLGEGTETILTIAYKKEEHNYDKDNDCR